MIIKIENLDVRKIAKTKNGYLTFVETEDGTPIKLYGKKKPNYERGDIITPSVSIQNDFFFLSED